MEKTKEETLTFLIIKLQDYISSSDDIISLQDSIIKELTESLEKSKSDNKKYFSKGVYLGTIVIVIVQLLINLLIK